MTTTHEQSRAIFFTGVEHFEAARFVEARGCFERCLALTPERPSVMGNLGVTLFRLGQSREALPWLVEATAAEPQFKDAWAALGLAHEAHGEWAAAVAALSKALALDDRSSALWFSLSRCAMRSGRYPQALDAIDRALAIDPCFAAAWSERGSLLREMRQLDAAAKSFEQAVEHGADAPLHAYYLAAVRGGSVPATPPRQYVETLFDDYAAEFSGHVVDKLGYRGHEVLLQPLLDGRRRFTHALDLGCGTGLCAPLLRQCCDGAIDGVDISSRMLDEARKQGVYRELVHADLGDFLAAAAPHSAQLVVAADVLIYVGDPAAVFAGVARLLEPGGVFAFTVELSGNGQDLQLLPSLRYAHSQARMQHLAAAHGLAMQSLRAAPIRHEQSQPVAGLYVHLRKTATERA